jgi:hypothetical protein
MIFFAEVDSTSADHATEHDQQKWEPVLRPNRQRERGAKSTDRNNSPRPGFVGHSPSASRFET